MKTRLTISLLVVCLTQGSFSSPVDSLSTHYQKGLNTDTWKAGIFSHFRSQKSFLELSETVSTSLLRIYPNEHKWKDDQNLFISFSKQLLPSLWWDLKAHSFLFSDKQTGFVNDIKTHLIGIGTTFKHPSFQIPVFAGIKEDHRFNQSDRGVNFNIRGSFPNLQWHQYNHSLNGYWEEDRLNERRNQTVRLSYQTHRYFSQNTEDSLQYNLYRQRRDYYISNEGEIESREEEGHELKNNLIYPLGAHVQVHLTGQFEFRKMKISQLSSKAKTPKRERNDFGASWQMRLDWKSNRISSQLVFGFLQQEQNYEIWNTATSSPYSGSTLFTAPDNRNGTTHLSLRAIWQMSHSDSLMFYSSLRRFRYDTPSESNVDDRDELRYRLEIQERHHFSNHLFLQVSLSMHFLHLVYIHGERSADNNWTRMIRFSPYARWIPKPNIRLSQSAVVLANYVNYDFETQLSGIRSFVYRKFRMEDTLQVDISDRLSLLTAYHLELDESGKLNWNNWLEQKLIEQQSHTLNGLFQYSPWHNLTVGSGYTFFRRQGYRFQNDTKGDQQRTRNLDFWSHGPLIQFIYRGQHLNARLFGSTTGTRTQSIAKQILTRIDLHMSWTF